MNNTSHDIPAELASEGVRRINAELNPADPPLPEWVASGRKLPQHVDQVISRHIDRVDQRVFGARDVYAVERQEVRVAARLVPILRDTLDLGEFLGEVGPIGSKPQLRLLFASAIHGPVVLKVYGRRRFGGGPSPAAVGSAWSSRRRCDRRGRRPCQLVADAVPQP